MTRLRPAKRRSRKPRLSGGINAARKSMNMAEHPQLLSLPLCHIRVNGCGGELLSESLVARLAGRSRVSSRFFGRSECQPSRAKHGHQSR